MGLEETSKASRPIPRSRPPSYGLGPWNVSCNKWFFPNMGCIYIFSLLLKWSKILSDVKDTNFAVSVL